jgi:copper oxidase (laccase) domain-containing protein
VFREKTVFAKRLPGGETRQFSALCCDRWLDRGFTHGFIGKDGVFKGEKLSADLAALAQGISSQSIAYLKQIHSADVVVASTDDCLQGTYPGDGWIIDVENDKGCWVIFTADCLPLMISYGNFMLLLHAGWRGLANGIVRNGIGQCMELVGSTLQSNSIEMLIGPAASKDLYEVGSEVLEEIGSSAVYVIEDGRSFLSLAETAANQFREAAANFGLAATVYDCGVCTINNPAWHSHRRDKENRGSNVMFFSREGERSSDELD